MKIKIYRTITFPVVLYRCATWSLKLREEGRLRMFENRVMRRIFRPRREEVTGEWRKLHNEELNDFYCSANIILAIKSRRMKWVVYVARIGRREVQTGFCRGNLRERVHLEDLGIGGRIILRCIFRKCDGA